MTFEGFSMGEALPQATEGPLQWLRSLRLFKRLVDFSK